MIAKLKIVQALEILKIVMEIYEEEKNFNKFYATERRSSTIYGRLIKEIEDILNE